MTKLRLDNFIVKFHNIESRAKAQDLIKANKVNVNGKIINKCNFLVSDSDIINIDDSNCYVSRAANKLNDAIQSFNINLNDKIVLDIGSSTGGFTQICLLNKAKKIYAVDVGTNQLHPSLASNSSVILYENTDFRDLSLSMFDDKIDFVCCDVSFISLTKILDKLISLFNYHYSAVFLIKPQYESKTFSNNCSKLVISDPNFRKNIVDQVLTYLKTKGFKIINFKQSPITGRKGNIEYLVYVSK